LGLRSSNKYNGSLRGKNIYNGQLRVIKSTNKYNEKY